FSPPLATARIPSVLFIERSWRRFPSPTRSTWPLRSRPRGARDRAAGFLGFDRAAGRVLRPVLRIMRALLPWREERPSKHNVGPRSTIQFNGRRSLFRIAFINNLDITALRDHFSEPERGRPEAPPSLR